MLYKGCKYQNKHGSTYFNTYLNSDYTFNKCPLNMSSTLDTVTRDVLFLASRRPCVLHRRPSDRRHSSGGTGTLRGPKGETTKPKGLWWQTRQLCTWIVRHRRRHPYVKLNFLWLKEMADILINSWLIILISTFFRLCKYLHLLLH